MFIISGCALAQPEITGAPWNVTLKVVGEDGQPVAAAHASVGYHKLPIPGEVLEDYRQGSAELAGLTDTNGIFVASHTDASWSLGIDVQKSGYYSTHIGYGLLLPGQQDSATVAENRNPTITLVLKKIGKPIPMYAKRVNLRAPVPDKPVGYDFEAGDWIAPYGKGISSDILFAKEYYEKSPREYYSKITVTFPNAGDGLQVYQVPDSEKGSGLRSSHDVPADGYQPELIREICSHPGQPIKCEYDPNRIYFFRVRTVLDEQGKVRSALYGKIYGDFMQFDYYLNPTPNDRNVEFDPKQNLLNGLKSNEQVMQP